MVIYFNRVLKSAFFQQKFCFSLIFCSCLASCGDSVASLNDLNNLDLTKVKVNDVIDPELHLATIPQPEQELVILNSKLVVVFSELMDSASFTSETFTLKSGKTLIPAKVSAADFAVTLTPLAPLPTYTTLVAKIAKEVKTKTGQMMAADYTWKFTTGELLDNEQLEVVKTVPEDLADNICLTPQISITFAQILDPLTANQQNFTLYAAGVIATPVSGAVSYDIQSKKIILTPFANLAPHTTYIVNANVHLQSLAGGTLSEPYVFSFTTGERDN